MLVRCWFAGTGPAPPAWCRACGHAGVGVVPAAGAGTTMAASNGSVPDRRFLPCGLVKLIWSNFKKVVQLLVSNFLVNFCPSLDTNFAGSDYGQWVIATCRRAAVD